MNCVPGFLLRPIVFASAALLGGCAVEAPVYVPAVEPAPYVAPVPPPVVSVYVEPPLFAPPPIAIAWAPPPLLVEAPPPLPFVGAVWIGGYWCWQGRWVWAAGRWAAPPMAGYTWVQPYYEHRNGAVVFVDAHWAAPGVVFVPPPIGLHISLAAALPGIAVGVAAILWAKVSYDKRLELR